MPVYDSQGQFIASVGTIRDVTTTFSDAIVRDSPLDEVAPVAETASAEPKKSKRGLFGKILGKSSSHYKDGVILYVKEKKYADAIAAFDKALESDNKLAHVWNDRGTCFRERGDHTSALKSLLRAVELYLIILNTFSILERPSR